VEITINTFIRIEANKKGFHPVTSKRACMSQARKLISSIKGNKDINTVKIADKYILGSL
jgi:hypothetical protein